jgi:hypothetical protein
MSYCNHLTNWSNQAFTPTNQEPLFKPAEPQEDTTNEHKPDSEQHS